MKKNILIFLLIVTTFLQADLVDIYRTQGIDAVKVALEKELKKETYWKKHLVKEDVSYGYYESKKYVIMAEKESKKLELYKKEDNKFLNLLTDSIIVGEKTGDKQYEGDLKTPIGAYRLTRKLTKLDQFYGPLALVTNYPNSFDKALNKNGHGIWIHGMPLEEEREKFTKGCIALDNQKLLNLDEKINYDESVLVISDKEVLATTKEDMSRVLAFIYSWSDAWRESNFNEYLSYYDQSFKRPNGQNFKQFKRHKKYIFAKKEKKTINFSNINIIPYPNSLDKHMFKVVMDQFYKTKTYKYTGVKELYIEIKENKIVILSEA